MATQRVFPQNKHEFPVGYHQFHKNRDMNFQLNRFYSFGYWTKEDAEQAGNAIKEIEDWKPVLVGLAEQHKAENRNLAAAFSYRAAEFYTLPSDPDKIPLYDQFIDLFYASIQDENMEKISIPFQSGAMPALRLKAENSKGTIVVHGGFDSFMEELYTMARYLADCGNEVILFEGPGQGATIRKHNIPITYQWEHSVSCVLDYFDLSDVTLVGISLGGYLSLRAAAFEERISRVVSYDISNYDQHGSGLQLAIYKFFLKNPPIYNWIAEKTMKSNHAIEWLMTQGMFINGVDTPTEWLAGLENFSVCDIADKVRQDVLLLAGEEDFMVPIKEYEKNRKGLTSARSITGRIFTKEEHAQSHCQVGNLKLALDVILDWIADKS